MAYDTRGQRVATKFRSRKRVPRRAPGRRRSPKSRYDALARARRRRFMGRRLGLVLTLAFLVAGVPLFGTSSSESGHVRPVSRVETGTLSEEPGSLPLDMGEVWATAAEENSSPDLATNGTTGTSGGRIALTFDDGPDPHSTPRILAVLRKQHVKATFFVVGRQV